MRIAIISTERTRSSLLGNYLKSQNNQLNYLGEVYTFAHKQGNHDVAGITKSLQKQDNCIVKIMGHNLNTTDLSPGVFQLETYDKIYLTERYDFFEQCSSLQVSLDTNVWHNLGDYKSAWVYKKMSNQKFTVTLDTMLKLANNLTHYLNIKKYLIENNIPYTVYSYDELKQYGIHQHKLAVNNLNYSDIITNYHLKEKINNLRANCFSFDSLESNIELFEIGAGEEIRTLDIFVGNEELYR